MLRTVEATFWILKMLIDLFFSFQRNIPVRTAVFVLNPEVGTKIGTIFKFLITQDSKCIC